jgi:hypothetical protein
VLVFAGEVFGILRDALMVHGERLRAMGDVSADRQRLRALSR